LSWIRKGEKKQREKIEGLLEKLKKKGGKR
jgi:hypothetical protein